MVAWVVAKAGVEIEVEVEAEDEEIVEGAVDKDEDRVDAALEMDGSPMETDAESVDRRFEGRCNSTVRSSSASARRFEFGGDEMSDSGSSVSGLLSFKTKVGFMALDEGEREGLSCSSRKTGGEGS